MSAVRDGARMAAARARRTASVRAGRRAPALVQRILRPALADRRALSDLRRHVNRAMPKHQRARAQGHDLEPVQRDHAADRPRPPRQGAHRGVLPRPRSTSRPGSNGTTSRGFIEDVMRFLDNVLQDFIDTRARQHGARHAIPPCASARSAWASWASTPSCRRSGMPFESVMAKVWNKKMFKHIRAPGRRGLDDAGATSAAPARTPPTAASMERFSHKMAIAPTASISIICGGTSRRHRADPGQRLHPQDAVGLLRRAQPVPGEAAGREGPRRRARPGSRSSSSEGSVQHLDFLDEDEKAVFKTAFEIDQRWLIELAADRAPYICQSQSLNMFLPGRRPQVGPAHAPLDGVGARREEPLLLPLQIASSAPAFAGQLEKADDRRAVATERTDYEECLAASRSSFGDPSRSARRSSAPARSAC